MKNLMQQIDWGKGIIASPIQMLKNGQAETRISERFAASSKATPRKAYFIDIKGTTRGIKITKEEFEFVQKHILKIKLNPA